MNKRFFYLGANIHQEALDIIRSERDAVVLYEDEDSRHVMDSLAGMAQDGRAHSIDSRTIVASAKAMETPFQEERERVLRAVLGDFKVFLLRMRFLRIDISGAFDGFAYFSDVVDYAIKLVGARRPETVFCAYTPHTVESWIIVRTIEELGARVVRLISSPLPWVLLPVQGLVNAGGCNLKAQPRPTRSHAIDEYLARLRGEYSAAMPYYEKAASLLSPDRLRSMIKGLRPRDLAKQMEKRAVWNEFQAAATPIPDGASFGVYFLHYQPEMNTLPEADLFCDQFQAVSKLAAALPEGAFLVVKEHPSTFSKRCDRRWRPKGFYARFLSLPNVRICPAETGTFELIDRAMFVASIAGVCLTEALARGKPAVSFYTPRFAEFSAGLVIDANLAKLSELRAAFLAIANGEYPVDRDALRGSLERVMVCGYDGALEHTYIPNSVSEAAANSKRANCLAIRDVIDGIL